MTRTRSTLVAAAILVVLALAFLAPAPSAAVTAREITGSVAAQQEIGQLPPTANGCTVTVDGKEKRGTWDGKHWCCVSNGGQWPTCYNCDIYTCRDTKLGDVGGDGDIPQVLPG